MKDSKLPVSINAVASFFPINMKILACFRIFSEGASVKLEATFSGKHIELFITVASLGVSVGVHVEADVRGAFHKFPAFFVQAFKIVVDS